MCISPDHLEIEMATVGSRAYPSLTPIGLCSSVPTINYLLSCKHYAKRPSLQRAARMGLPLRQSARADTSPAPVHLMNINKLIIFYESFPPDGGGK